MPDAASSATRPIAIFTIGTLGDVLPCVALGQGLQRAGYPVRIATSANFAPLVREAGLEHYPLTADFQAMLEADRSIADRGLNLYAMARTFRARYADWARHWTAEGLAASDGAGLLIGVSNAIQLAKALSEARGLPFAIARLQPLTPSRILPPMVMAGARERLPGALSLGLYKLIHLLVWYVMKPAINDLVRPQLGLARFPWHGPHLGRNAQQEKTLNGYSPSLLPRPADWPASSQITGYWFAQASAWQPSEGLRRFLADGDKPVYVGFGSMVNGDAAAFTRTVLDALARSGLRAVLATGWGGLDGEEGQRDERSYVLRQAPHDALFPHMCAAVHHGGAGTTAAAVRAGIPSVVVPFYGDQPFWARCLHARGVAPPAVPRKPLDAARLAAAIVATQASAMREAAAQLGRTVRAEDGIGAALSQLLDWGLLAPLGDRHADPVRPRARSLWSVA
ncbi:glycosyltransferase [Lysobacter sp. 5GHs7-4]|uniref:glycosyltransferase n=1 Tax=Lysobacter sp. 5GHs7-4 TaxID=2904253 RepID=UPI001E504756|nr:glycosyltransferase [Lysobacter sp. 5GHs7-4]UHQ22825.1 glycosyltransferase [Lysobacter sp. 5GHs7-4]